LIKLWNELHGPRGWLMAAVLVIVMAWFLVKILKEGAEALLKLHDWWKSRAAWVAMSEEKKTKLKQHHALAKVVLSDIGQLNKNELWHDQYFTDLEAEVEAEGRYYASRLDRFLSRQSQGLRRVRSLIRAIDTSAEPALLLVGEPGSGKSVALRHLALQLAERAVRSADPTTRIPLYINLKELPPAPPDGPDADFIKAFVIENVRRGDADTADSIREKWNEYRDRGIWFFLFDSFDEIPAVMHAPSGSPAIRQHAEAIRQFLASMGDCRGCLASREFKGPDSLPWQKFRILPLSTQKQEELVGNTSLSRGQKQIVLRHLADEGTTLRTNPMFLTLLCRYVRQEDYPPVNDHALLQQHIARLAERDPDYTRKRFGLTPKELLDGAKRLSVLFAENPDLSLAPPLDQIKATLPARDPLADGLEDLLAALVDVKIGRSDVREARVGDRRFTFSHRRYQETLFVQFLAEHPGHITPRELLTDPRWREYTVTLLQTQSRETIAPLQREAEAMLRAEAASQRPVMILPEFGGHLSYYNWRGELAVHLLLALQEGLSRRLDDVSAELSDAVEAHLGPRWRDGDVYDRMMVLKLGALLPQSLLQDRLAASLKDASLDIQEAVFQRIVSLRSVPPELADWLRRRLADEILSSRGRVKLLKLEALSSRLPDTVGASFVLDRCRHLNRLVKLFLRPFYAFLRLVKSSLVSSSPASATAVSMDQGIILHHLTWVVGRFYSPSIILLQEIIISAFAIGLSLLSFGTKTVFAGGSRLYYFLAATGAILATVAIRLQILSLFRTTGSRINLALLARSVALLPRKMLRIESWSIFIPIVNVTAIFLLPGAIVHLVAYHLGYRGIDFDWYIMSGIATAIAGALVYGVLGAILALRQRRRLADFLRLATGSRSIVLQAGSLGEVSIWIDRDLRALLPNEAAIRSFALLILRPNMPHPPALHELPLFQQMWKANSPRVQYLIDRLIEDFRVRGDGEVDGQRPGPEAGPKGDPGHVTHVVSTDAMTG
jgi:hypothetical protein